MGYEEPTHTPLDTVMMKKKGVNLTLISAVLSKTQLDFTQLNHTKARFPPKHQQCLDVLAQSATCLDSTPNLGNFSLKMLIAT